MTWLTRLVSALVLILLSTQNLLAQTCPNGTPKTKIYFINGIDNTKKNAQDSAKALLDAVLPKIQRRRRPGDITNKRVVRNTEAE